jgi:hypothetical protein
LYTFFIRDMRVPFRTQMILHDLLPQ